MTYKIERDWITQAGLRAVVLISTDRTENHRCGYVAVDETHPAFNKGYSEQLDFIPQEAANNSVIGNKSPILALTATCESDDPYNSVRRSLDIIIDVHGGLTYSSKEPGAEYPVPSEGLWWFGYDCGHYNDNACIGGQSLEYCVQQCELMARQLVELAVPATTATKGE